MASEGLEIAVTLTGAELSAAKLDAVEKALADTKAKVSQLGAEWDKTLPKVQEAGKGFGGVSKASQNLGRDLGMQLNVLGETAYMVGAAVPQFRNLGMTMVMAGGNAVTLGASFGPIGVAIAGVTAAVPMLITALSDTGTEAEATKKTVAELAEELDNLARKSLAAFARAGFEERLKTGDVSSEEAQFALSRQLQRVTQAQQAANLALQDTGIAGSGVEALLSAAERRPDQLEGALRSWGLTASEEAKRAREAVKQLADAHRELRRIRDEVAPEAAANAAEMAEEELLGGSEEFQRQRRAGRKQGPTLEQLMGQSASIEQMRQMSEGFGEVGAFLDQEDLDNALEYLDLVEKLNQQDERAHREKLRRHGEFTELTEELRRDLEDNLTKQRNLQETGLELGFDENDILRERYRLLEEQYALEGDIRRAESDANDERIRKIKEQAKLQEEEAQRKQEAEREFLAATAQAADIASMSTKLVLGETKEALAIESVIRAAQEGAEAISSLASYDYWGFAQHLLAASLHGVAAAKAGSAGGTPSKASGGGGGSQAARPTNERDNRSGGGTTTTTVIFNHTVSEAEVGRLTYRAQRAADRRYGRSAA